jgi:hypothetical protein
MAAWRAKWLNEAGEVVEGRSRKPLTGFSRSVGSNPTPSALQLGFGITMRNPAAPEADARAALRVIASHRERARVSRGWHRRARLRLLARPPLRFRLKFHCAT